MTDEQLEELNKEFERTFERGKKAVNKLLLMLHIQQAIIFALVALVIYLMSKAI